MTRGKPWRPAMVHCGSGRLAHHAYRSLLAGIAGACLAVSAVQAQMAVPATSAAGDPPPRQASVASGESLVFRPLTPGEHLVIVRGFRIRSTVFETRSPAIDAGMASAAMMADCDRGPCGFVVLHTEAGYRYTSVVAAPEAELISLAQEFDRPGMTFVLVHPPASRLRTSYVLTGKEAEMQMPQEGAPASGTAATRSASTGPRN